MAADLRTTPTWDNLLYARSKVVHAAAAAPDRPDRRALSRSQRHGRHGARGRGERRTRLHRQGRDPSEADPVLNEIFSPSADAVERAKRIIRAFAESGTGLVVIDGKLIERPVLRSMQRLVAIADAAGRRAKP